MTLHRRFLESAIDLHELDFRTKLVLIVLCRHADVQGHGAIPSSELLWKSCHANWPPVVRCLDDLQRCGLIRWNDHEGRLVQFTVYPTVWEQGE